MNTSDILAENYKRRAINGHDTFASYAADNELNNIYKYEFKKLFLW